MEAVLRAIGTCPPLGPDGTRIAEYDDDCGEDPVTLIKSEHDPQVHPSNDRSSSAHSVVVQIVLYNNRYHRVFRTVQSAFASIHRAQSLQSVTEAAILVGDSSDTPSLTEDQVHAISKAADDGGIEFGYRFFGQNLGSAGGSNRLARHGDSDLVLVLNPDTYLHPDTVHLLTDSMRGDVAIAEARQIPVEHPKTYDPLSGDTSWASGACMLIDRIAFDTVGGFDTEYFFLHCDDVDFSWRVRMAGWRVRHVPRAIVFHDKRLDAEGRLRAPPAERYYGILGRLMLCKRYGATEVLDHTVARIERRRDPTHLRALEEFQRRDSIGATPPTYPETQRGTIPEFRDGNYARHRF